MKCIHLLRKPCSEGTVAANVLRHGTGAMNIDGCRIDSGGTHGSAESAGQGKGYKDTQKYGIYSKGIGGVVEPPHPGGRWPANLMLQHLDGCHMVGTATVLGDSRTSDYSPRQSGMFNVGQVKSDGRPRGTLHGDQSVPVYDCAPGCPVAALDAQSGIRQDGVAVNRNRTDDENRSWFGKRKSQTGADVGYGGGGGASRYFKQFTTPPMNTTSDNMNTDLADYLRALISPEERTLTTQEGGECVYLHVTAPDTFPWGEYGDASVHGLTVESSSLAGQSVWLPEAIRVLKPGAHLLLAAPDEEPTGHTGACIAEDAGFEVRDAILWVYGEGAGDRLHYTAKAARAEREAGLYVEVGEVENEGGKRKNVHPTVKPVSVMARLLGDISKDCGPVVDPFLGSGTTLLACIETGHDGIGIEREREYIEIADARVRHRDYETAGWNRAHIVSDVAPVSPADGESDGESAREQSLDDFFGL